MPFRYRRFVPQFAVILLLCVASYLWVDRPVAIWAKQHVVDGAEALFAFITDFGLAQYYLVPAGLIWLAARYLPLPGAMGDRLRRMRDGALYVFLSVAGSGLFVDLLKMLFGRYRPQELFQHGLYGFDPIHAGWVVASFPSGHSQTAFAAMMPLVRLMPRRRLLWIGFALLIPLSRILLSLHYVSDTLMGSWIGAVGAVVIGDALAARQRRAQADSIAHALTTAEPQ